jgi:hypothetical protein
VLIQERLHKYGEGAYRFFSVIGLNLPIIKRGNIMRLDKMLVLASFIISISGQTAYGLSMNRSAHHPNTHQVNSNVRNSEHEVNKANDNLQSKAGCSPTDPRHCP